jgi:hypothetical protein
MNELSIILHYTDDNTLPHYSHWGEMKGDYLGRYEYEIYSWVDYHDEQLGGNFERVINSHPLDV